MCITNGPIIADTVTHFYKDNQSLLSYWISWRGIVILTQNKKENVYGDAWEAHAKFESNQ